MACTFGDGTVITFTNSNTPTIEPKELGQFRVHGVAQDATPLSQGAGTYARMCFGNRLKHEPIPIEHFFDHNELALKGGYTTFLMVSQTMTITYPDGSQKSGVGRIIEWNDGQMINDEVSVGSLMWQFLGGVASTISHQDNGS